ncbi:MAG: hypothetical protein HY454_00485 [Parcubacteria group bacterium]|nr:hypothetical protein [Parcubacteria group bacterium]
MWLTYVVGVLMSLVAVGIIILIIIIFFLKAGPFIMEMFTAWKTITDTPDLPWEAVEKIKAATRTYGKRKNIKEMPELLQKTNKEVNSLLKELWRNMEQHGPAGVIISPRDQDLIKRTLAACRRCRELDPDNDMEPLMGVLLRLAIRSSSRENNY